MISFLYSLPSQKFYNSGHYVSSWPYAFLFIFALTTVILNTDKVTAKLTEGITLLLSLSIIYWVIDYGFTSNMFEKTLLIVALLFSAFSILNAFTYIRLTPIIRLILSIGSTIIMLSFAADNIYRVFSSEEIEHTKYLSKGLNIGIQYFLLGVSAIYIVQNYLLLASFFPGKNVDSEMMLNDNKKHHIDRYSEGQVLIRHAVICIFYALTIYGLNFKYHILPRHTMIWLVFLTFPFLIRLIKPTQKISS